MAASKKKQDEKHLKILRELVSEPGNKKCAECQQRGPTYVDMTMGTFICTTCSGLLRGINPPHRVKSITMTSFSPEEIEKLRNSGNEKCNRIYVGKWTEPRDPGPETMEDMKIKFFLQDKYERRRWYLEPGSEPPKRGGVVAGSNTPETKPLSHLLGGAAPKLIVGTRTDSPVSTPPVSRGTPPVSRGTPNLPAPPGVQRKSSQVQQQPFATSVAPEPAAAPKQESLLDLNEAFSAPAPQPSQPFGGQPVFPPASGGGGGGFGAFTSFSSAPPPPAAASTMLSSSPFGSTSLNAAPPPTSLAAAAPAMTSAGDKYAAFGSLSSSSSQPQPVSTNIDWSGGINWASGGGTSTSMMTSTASSADGMSWGAAASSQQQQQQQSSVAPSMGGGGGGGVSQMNWGAGNAGSMGFSSTTSSAMTWNQPQQPQQQQSAAFSSSNPFGSAAATQQQQQQQQQQPQSQPQPAQGNPFGSFGNIGGTTRGPADATLFNKPQPQQQTFVQQQQPGGFVGQQQQQPGGFVGQQQQQPGGFVGQQQQLGGGFAMQQQPQPSMGGFGGAGGGFQQQPGGFPGGGQAGFSAGGFGQQQAFGAQMMAQPQGQSFGGQMGGQFVQAAPVQGQFGGWGGQPQQQSNPFMMGGQPQQQQQQQQQQQMMGRGGGGGINPFM